MSLPEYILPDRPSEASEADPGQVVVEGGALLPGQLVLAAQVPDPQLGPLHRGGVQTPGEHVDRVIHHRRLRLNQLVGRDIRDEGRNTQILTPVLLRMLEPTGLNSSISASNSFTMKLSASTNLMIKPEYVMR